MTAPAPEPNEASPPPPAADAPVPDPGSAAEPPDPRPRYKLVLAYDGSGFHGWQRQVVPQGPPLRTVQGVLHDALQQLLRQPIGVIGASRTDAGVHAHGQVAHFNAETPIPVERLRHAINSRLPDDLEVRAVERVDPAFHAIRDVVSKQYRYAIHHAEDRPLELRHTVYHCWTPLSLEMMRDAAARLVGRHDFAGFAAAGHGRQSTVRTIHRCGVEQAGERITVVVEGDGFLYNMVRIIAGTLVEVGRGRFDPAQVDRVLAEGDRRSAGPTLPPQGLCLAWIAYGPPGGGRRPADETNRATADPDPA